MSLSSPRKLKVCHFKKGTEICNYSYSNTILAVKLNRMVRFSGDGGSVVLGASMAECVVLGGGMIWF